MSRALARTDAGSIDWEETVGHRSSTSRRTKEDISPKDKELLAVEERYATSQRHKVHTSAATKRAFEALLEEDKKEELENIDRKYKAKEREANKASSEHKKKETQLATKRAKSRKTSAALDKLGFVELHQRAESRHSSDECKPVQRKGKRRASAETARDKIPGFTSGVAKDDLATLNKLLDKKHQLDEKGIKTNVKKLRALLGPGNFDIVPRTSLPIGSDDAGAYVSDSDEEEEPAAAASSSSSKPAKAKPAKKARTVAPLPSVLKASAPAAKKIAVKASTAPPAKVIPQLMHNGKPVSAAIYRAATVRAVQLCRGFLNSGVRGLGTAFPLKQAHWSRALAYYLKRELEDAGEIEKEFIVQGIFSDTPWSIGQINQDGKTEKDDRTIAGHGFLDKKLADVQE